MKEIRDKARALEVYAAQALNRDAERKAAEIRVRAERKTGELLKQTKESGELPGNEGCGTCFSIRRSCRSRPTSRHPSWTGATTRSISSESAD